MKEKEIKDLQDNLEIQKQMFRSETERLEREKREKENLIAEMKHENTQLRESMQLQLNQSQMSNQMELHRLKELEEMIRNLQY
jgi:predicted metal-dependent hydrolase